MSTTPADDDREHLFSELAAHDRLGEALIEHPERVFVSDWNGDHPFMEDFLGELGEAPIGKWGSLGTYSRMDEDLGLSDAVAELHVRRYGEPGVTAQRCVTGAGATSFLTTLLMYQYLQGFREISYLPPVYYNAAWWIRRLGLGVRRVATDVDFASNVELDLPDDGGLLWVTDPVWFAGLPVRSATIDRIAEWQGRTGATVIVDGTFQYMGWEGATAEAADRLDPDLTFRLVCPTKTLAMHGFRFAYAVVPEQHSASFTELHKRLHGPAGLADRLFAHRAVEVLGSHSGALPLMDFARLRYRELVDSGAVTEAVKPETGFFLFGRPSVDASEYVAMDASCFGGQGYPGYVRINLLNPAAVGLLTR
ncbi:aminotransferase class I/II-fold pyridoxal phosphate-dependent enzyme [Nocardioides sp. LML1-1-1.1]|uniref:aminotransferase class I/II-fold pyridoxal phosphate-dependent enzyme n=1 Tax=Nocardioides sp. LML1-1-1.1 TaxID=3135248 RepID=UPI00341E9396